MERLVFLATLESVFPEIGTRRVEVHEVPLFELTVVPFVWTEDSDQSLVDAAMELTRDDELFWMTRELLPVNNQDFSLTVRDFLWTSSAPVFENNDELLRAVRAVRASDGKGGHYMGLLAGGPFAGGVADTPGPISLVSPDPQTIVHELGHNMLLWHAPCGRDFLPGGIDPNFPTHDGSISNWGYNILATELVPPDTPDFMGYCGPPSWISGYNFTRASKFRLSAYYKQYIQSPPILASARSLLLWGGVDEEGALVLEPSFVIEANTLVPREFGPYRIQGYDASGRVLFTLDFAMVQNLCWHRHFCLLDSCTAGLVAPISFNTPYGPRGNGDGRQSGRTSDGTSCRRSERSGTWVPARYPGFANGNVIRPPHCTGVRSGCHLQPGYTGSFIVVVDNRESMMGKYTFT